MQNIPVVKLGLVVIRGVNDTVPLVAAGLAESGGVRGRNVALAVGGPE